LSTYVLVPGAGGMGWYWHRVVPLLERAGHEVIALDLPGDDPKAGLAAYVELTLRAMAGRANVVLVGQSLGGFTVAGVAARVPLQALVFVNAMIPAPRETPGEWGDHTGSSEARVAAAKEHGYPTKFDLETYFLHDVPRDVAEEAAKHEHPETENVFGDPCPFERWPDVPTRALAGREDRLFPLAFQQRVAKDRLGIDVEPIPGGHLAALSYPDALVAQLLSR
jgi:pimeloyl-ACP methyl ester carboxylesterase